MALTDIIGPVMIGPSSSHTAGAARLGKVVYKLWGRPITEATMYLRGSFAATYWGHGTDRALVGGLMGWGPDDDRLPRAFDMAREAGMTYSFREEDVDGAHPNSVRFVISDGDRTLQVVGASVGGGAVVVSEIDGFPVEFGGDLPTLVVFHRDKPGVVAAVTAELSRMSLNIAGMSLRRRAKGEEAVVVIQIDGTLDDQAMRALESFQNAYPRAFLLPAPGEED